VWGWVGGWANRDSQPHSPANTPTYTPSLASSRVTVNSTPLPRHQPTYSLSFASSRPAHRIAYSGGWVLWVDTVLSIHPLCATVRADQSETPCAVGKAVTLYLSRVAARATIDHLAQELAQQMR